MRWQTFASLLLIPASSFGITDLWTSSSTEMYTRMYATGANGALAFSFATANPGNPQNLVYQLGGNRTTLETNGSITSLAMNGQGMTLWAHRRQAFSTITSSVGLFSGGTRSTLTTTTNNPGSYENYYGTVSAGVDGTYGYTALNGSLVVKRAGENTAFSISGVNFPGNVAVIDADRAFVSRSVLGKMVISTVDLLGKTLTDVVTLPSTGIRGIDSAVQVDAAGRAYFIGRDGSNQSTLFRYTDGIGLQDLGASLPSRNLGTYLSVNADGQVALLASVSGKTGIYAISGGQFEKVAAYGDTYKTGTFTDLYLSENAWQGNHLVFGYSNGFGFSSSGYAISGPIQAVPEPASLVALGCGAAAMLRRRRKR